MGSAQVITVPDHNTLPLEAFAAQHGQGLSNMLEANPGVDPFYRNPVPDWWYLSSSFFPIRFAKALW